MRKDKIRKEFEFAFNTFKNDDKLYFLNKLQNKIKFEKIYSEIVEVVKINAIDYAYFKIVSVEEDDFFINLKNEFHFQKEHNTFTYDFHLCFLKNKRYFDFYLQNGNCKYFD